MTPSNIEKDYHSYRRVFVCFKSHRAELRISVDSLPSEVMYQCRSKETPPHFLPRVWTRRRSKYLFTMWYELLKQPVYCALIRCPALGYVGSVESTSNLSINNCKINLTYTGETIPSHLQKFFLSAFSHSLPQSVSRDLASSVFN